MIVKKHKRKAIAEMFLTGESFNSDKMLRRIRGILPNADELHTTREIFGATDLLLRMGVAEKVGKDMVRIRPELLVMLKEGVVK